MYTPTGPLEMRMIEERLLDSVILEVEGYRAPRQCIGCFDCTPRIVHIMQMRGNIPVFDRLELLCRNPSVPEAMRTFLCLHQRPNWVRAASGTLEPDFANITAPTEPITSLIGAQAVEEHPQQHWVDGEAWPDYLDDHHHHHHHPESQVGRNCAPRIGKTYYIGPDGEAFCYDDILCQATELNDDTTWGNTSCVNAMQTVHPSIVRWNTQLADGQPR